LFAARVENASGAGAPATPVPVPAASRAITVPPPPAYDVTLEERLARQLAGAIDARRLELIRDTRGLVVSMPDDAAFSIGSAEATAPALEMVRRIGETLRDVPNAIRVEGHTDDVPIRTAKYGSNWELSTARASAVVAFLVGTVGIDASRLSAAGYGQYHPLNPNDTNAHRARNRRVDVVVLDVPAAAARAVPPVEGEPRVAP
jgi:chemotaxis protein MotB